MHISIIEDFMLIWNLIILWSYKQNDRVYILSQFNISIKIEKVNLNVHQFNTQLLFQVGFWSGKASGRKECDCTSQLPL